MIQTQEQLKMSIMGRVYMAYGMRRVFRSSTIRALLSVGSLVSIFSFVSVLNVVRNLVHVGGPSAVYDFSVSAVSHTEFGVQMALLAFTVAVAWYVADTVRQFISPVHSRNLA